MSVVQVLNARLQRTDQSVSWGFNVQGGVEFHSPLMVQKVNAGSLADRCSIRPGDYILKIGNVITEHLTHNEARDVIVRQGNNLELTLQRGAPPRPDDYTAKLEFPQHQLMTPENLESKPTLSPQVGVQLAKNKALLTQSYNSPVGLYSSQNIAETLVSTMKQPNTNNNYNNNDEEKSNTDELKLDQSSININNSTTNTSIANSTSSASLSMSASTSTSASASVSPVSNTSSSSSNANTNLNETNSNYLPPYFSNTSLNSSGIYNNNNNNNNNNNKPLLDLNPKPKPFTLRKSSATIESVPLFKFQTADLNHLNRDFKNSNDDSIPNNFSDTSLNTLTIDINNNNNNESKEEDAQQNNDENKYLNSTTTTFKYESDLLKAVPIKLVEEKKQLSISSTIMAPKPFNKSYDSYQYGYNKTKKYSLPTSMIGLTLNERKSLDKLDNSDDAELKENLKKELLTRLNPNPRLNDKGTAIINGRLLLKKITDSLQEKPDSDDSDINFNITLIQPAEAATAEYKNQETVANNISINKPPTNFESPSSFRRKLSTNNMNINSANDSIITKPKENSTPVRSPVKPEIRNSPILQPRKQVAKLNDPSVPSVTQSRTFRLLQETLDNGLTKNEPPSLNESSNNNKNRKYSLASNFYLSSNSRIKSNPLGKVAEDQPADKHSSSANINNINNNNSNTNTNTKLNKQNLMEKYNLSEDSDDYVVEQRKKYIRSLSLANDESAEPKFLKDFLQRDTVKKSTLVIKASSLIDETPANKTGSITYNNNNSQIISSTNNNIEPLDEERSMNMNNPNLVQAAQNIAPMANPSRINANSTNTSSSFNPIKSNNYVNNNFNASAGYTALPPGQAPPSNEPSYLTLAVSPSGHQPQAPQPQYNPYPYQQPQRFQPQPQPHPQPQPQPQRPYHAPVAAAAPAPPAAGPRSGQRNFIRGVKGSALLNNSNPSGVPTCAACSQLIRGPFVSAIGKTFCPHHFVCASCNVSLQDIGFVEENGNLYCEKDYEIYFAPKCHKCHQSIMGDCCYALEKSYHLECFVCFHCKQKIGSGTFHIENGNPYCPRDFNALFSTKCAGCDFPIEAGDKFLEALSQNWHVECFTCSTCHVPLHSAGFAAKGNKPYCKKHAY